MWQNTATALKTEDIMPLLKIVFARHIHDWSESPIAWP